MKRVLWIFCAAALALVACNKNNTENTSGDAGKLSDLEYFQDALVTLDQNGSIRGYNVGQNLNEADPSEITVPVDTYDEARELFLRWLPSGSKPSVSGKTYTWEMTDQENKAEKGCFCRKLGPGYCCHRQYQRFGRQSPFGEIHSLQRLAGERIKHGRLPCRELLCRRYHSG